MTRRRLVFGALAAAALFLLLGRWIGALYTDFLWYESLGAAEVWRTRVVTTLMLGGTSFAVAALFAFVNLYAVRQSVVSLVLPRRIANIEIGEEVPGRYLLFIAAGLAAVVGVAMMMPGDEWFEALLAGIGRPFGETDPYFGADLGFFVYWLPFETTAYYWTILVFSVVTMLVVLLYALTPSLRWERGRLYVSAYVRRHFTMLCGVLLGLLAWSYRLAMYRLLAEGGGTGGVFTSIDHRVLVPAMLLLAVVTLCAGLVVLWAGWSGQMRLAFLAVTVVLGLSVVGRSVAPLLARRSIDPADAVARERPYLATRLSYTRVAYGVDRIRPDTIGAGFRSPAEAAARSALWDGVTLSQAAERLRRVRVVGDGAAWQERDGILSALLVEHSSEGASEGALDARDVWGLSRFDPTIADDRGMPVRSGAGTRFGDETLLDEPAVYTDAPDYSVVSDSLGRIAGVEMVSTSSRIAHAWALQNFRLLFGDLPLNRPTIVRHRDVRDRVQVLAPFFVQGSEVVPVVAGDSLFWAIELYTASDGYPLSQRLTVLGEERGYFQHAATALVHAASGRVRLVTVPAPDPVAASWIERFPSLFVNPTALARVIQTALPPATDAAHTQALAFAAAGFRGDSLEVRHLAAPDGADSASSREPLHVALPGSGVSELWPLLDEQDRVRGVIAAEGGVPRVTAWIPLASDGARWNGVLDRLRAADTTTHENGLVRSPVRVLPAAGLPVYAQSIFQWRPGGSPRIVRVAALVGDSVRVGTTLVAAVGGAAQPHATEPAPRDLRARADSLYRVMREALARGDWGAFGRAFDALGAALKGSAP
jgi:uncharacterized membrane protein (UPF0182 family)